MGTLFGRFSRVGGSALVLVGSLLFVHATSATAAVAPGTPSQVTALLKSSLKITQADSTILNQLIGAPGDNWANVFSIPSGTNCETATACVFGDTSSTQSVVLYGDSHARMWLPAINPEALRDHVKLVLLGKDGCPVVSMNLRSSQFVGCNQVRVTVLAVINALRPRAVVLADRTTGTGVAKKAWQNAMLATIKAIKPSGAHIVVLQDMQSFTISPPQCIGSFPSKVQTKCAIANPNPLRPNFSLAEKAAATTGHATYVLTDPWMCVNARCSPIIGEFLPRFDASHVTASYAQFLSGVMGLALQRAFST